MMKAYNLRYRSICESDIDLIADINTHLSKGMGKQLRPLLAFLTSRCLGLKLEEPQTNDLYSVAASLEMLHNSSLIHDDVIDESDTRRGIDTVNRIKGNKIAVLFGDYYLALVMKTINEINNPHITSLINNTALSMCQGELLQQQCCGKYDISADTCLQVIDLKTACFMSACCEAGAIFANASANDINNARELGRLFGIAFQLRDDMHDFLPQTVTGKPQGNDIYEHKATMPIIMTLREQKDQETKQRLIDLLNADDTNESHIAQITDIVMNNDGWKKTNQMLADYIAQAETILNQMPDNNFRNGLSMLLKKL